MKDLNVGHEPFVGSDTFEHASLMEEREYYPCSCDLVCSVTFLSLLLWSMMICFIVYSNLGERRDKQSAVKRE